MTSLVGDRRTVMQTGDDTLSVCSGMRHHDIYQLRRRICVNILSGDLLAGGGSRGGRYLHAMQLGSCALPRGGNGQAHKADSDQAEN